MITQNFDVWQKEESCLWKTQQQQQQQQQQQNAADETITGKW